MSTALAMQTRIAPIGNSPGIRVPKPLLEPAGISEQVNLEVRDAGVSILPAPCARTGWKEPYTALAAQGDDRLLDGAQLAGSAWDEEWEW